MDLDLGRPRDALPTAVNSTSLLVLFPVTLASNIFVDPETMPGWLQTFVEVNPISHLVAAARGLMEGATDTREVGWVLLVSAGLVAVFAPLTMFLYRTRE